MVVSIVAYISASPSDAKKKEPPPPPTLEELGVRASAEEAEAELANTGWAGFWSTPQQGAGAGAPGVAVAGGKWVGSEEEEG